MLDRVCVVYAWVCPSTGRPVYVGKTSMPLDRRMHSHKRAAVKGADLTPKYRWLAEIIAQRRAPRVVILAECSVSQSAAVERRWARRLGLRFALLNDRVAGGGNPGVGRVDWTPEVLARLGTVADSEIAKELGCERKTVSYRRNILGIPASFDRTNNTSPPDNSDKQRIVLPDHIIAQLGTMPDYVLGRIAGVSKYTIARARDRLSIPSYAKATGNDGRIKTGEPHRCWSRRPKRQGSLFDVFDKEGNTPPARTPVAIPV